MQENREKKQTQREEREGLSEVWLSEIPEEEVRRLEKACGENAPVKVSFCRLSVSEACEKVKHLAAGKNGVLLLTSNQELLDLASDRHLAAAAYQAPGSLDYLRADLIIEGFEETDFSFLQHIYERKHQIPWTILETERCIVRELSVSDVPELFRMYKEQGMTDYMESLLSYEEEAEYQRAYIRNQYHFYGYGMWLVFEKKSGRLIGRAGVEQREEEAESSVLELGYAIRPDCWRQGYGYEVCQAVIRYMEEYFGAEELYCQIAAENTASIRLAEKLGFVLHQTKQDGKLLIYRRKESRSTEIGNGYTEI